MVFSMKTDNVLKTGTTTLGIVCKDGIILAADKRATAGYVASKKELKILQITDRIAITTAGTVSDIQLLAKIVRAEVRLKDYNSNRGSGTREVAHLLAGLMYHNIRKFSVIPGVVGFLLGGYDSEGPKLFELSPDGALMESEDYATDGSGSVFALGVFETLYKKGLSTDDGVSLAVKALNAALQRDIYSGNGIYVVKVTGDGVKTVLERDINVGLSQ